MSRITIRRNKISKGRETLYLDVYPPVPNPTTGKLQRKYYLKAFVYTDPSGNLQRKHNSETLQLVEHMRAKFQLEVQAKRYDFISESRLNANFIDFFEAQAEKRYGNSNWRMAVEYFKAFAGDVFPLSYLNENVCEEYAQFLLSSPAKGRANKKIGTNTAVCYYNRFKSTLRLAFKKRLLSVDLASLIDGIPLESTHREFLQLHELEKLVQVPCDCPLVKKAGLFSALTGFRYSDVVALQWKDIRGVSGDFYISYKQKKTSNQEYFPLADRIVNLIGARKADEIKVFEGLKYDQVVRHLPKWMQLSGIERHVTFHCFRHTFATLQIAAGTSIYTVSKLLGHKHIQTTEIYAKIVDNLKKEATERIQLKSLQSQYLITTAEI